MRKIKTRMEAEKSTAVFQRMAIKFSFFKKRDENSEMQSGPAYILKVELTELNMR